MALRWSTVLPPHWLRMQRADHAGMNVASHPAGRRSYPNPYGQVAA
ncbi:hypothetical protein SXCC_01193 [Gluconacetobacter sp. SXCC-1]|nr:hypothetical protein SXCC_01193 [Gluconacetobacter sp. SXCC-1]